MEMHQIRYFLAVCESLNFTRAAEACNVTQPALTRAVQKLEEELGGLLLRRERSRTHLTEFGQTLRPHLEEVLRNAAGAATTAKSFLSLDNAPLRLGVMCTVGPLRCIGLMAQFNREHPGIAVTLHEGAPVELTAMLEQAQLDLAIMADPNGFADRFKVEPLYRERFAVAFPPGHRFAGMEEVPTIACDGESYLMRINCEYGNYWDDFLQENKVDLKEVYRSEREDWIQTMVMAGMGICFIPEFSPIMPGLHTRPLREPEVYREVSLVNVPGRRFSPAVAAFVKTVKRYPWQRSSSSH
jgi:LysR family transcriptional regulator, hydrogen peroxide-inducible genes activator